MINFGVIGCGCVSNLYLYTLNKNPNVKISAVSDINLKQARKNAQQFNIKGIYSDYEKMLDCEDLDAVIVCTPHYLHHDQTLKCFEKGLDVLCEKPLATKMEDVYDMVNKARKVKFGVMLQRRAYPNSKLTKKVIDSEKLGEIKEVSLDFKCHKTPEFYNTWRGKAVSGGGTLMSQALHRIDQLVYFFGPATSVEGEIKTTRDYIEVEDYAKGKVYFNNGIVANIESNNSSGDSNTSSLIKIIGSKGNLLLSDDKTLIWNIPGLFKPSEININDIPAEYRPPYYGPAHEIVINDFVDAIIENKPPKIKGSDSIPVMELLFGFYKSAKEKRKILL